MSEKQIVGECDCLTCGREIPVKGTKDGGVSVSCSWCDLSAYAKKGTEAMRRIMERLKAKPAAAPAPVAASGGASSSSAAPKKDEQKEDRPWMR